MDYNFRWRADGNDHAFEHGISCEECEYVVRHARRPYPRRIGDDKWQVWGQTAFGEYVQVVYVEDPPPRDTVYVIHARVLEEAEKRLYRRTRR